MNFATWPFASPANRLPAEEERWWEICYTPPPVQTLAEGYSQGCIILGGYQSGRSTLLAALKRSAQADFLVLEDEFLSQPGQDKPAGNVLYRLVSQAIWAIRERLREQPELFLRIRSRTVLEFIRWGIEKFHGQRAFVRWLDGLPDEQAILFQNMPFEDFYPTQHSLQDVQGQIEELLNLSRRLGYTGLVYLIDVFPFPTPAQMQELYAFLGWRELMHHPGLKFVIALPPVLNRQEIQSLLRDRLPILELETSPNFIQEVIERHLRASTNGKIQALEQICSSALLRRIEKMLCEELGTSSLGAWLQISQLALELLPDGDQPLGEGIFSRLFHLYLARFCPLHPDPNPARLGIWRGYQWIELDRSLYDFLQSLAHSRQPVDHHVIMTTKNNLHTLASRLRKKVEPKDESIYLKNTRGEGYTLEHYRFRFP